MWCISTVLAAQGVGNMVKGNINFQAFSGRVASLSCSCETFVYAPY